MDINKDAVNKILDKRSELCSSYLQLVRITGKRNSFICGSSPDYPLPFKKGEHLLENSFKLIGQRKTGDFTSADLLILEETGELIEKYLP